MPSTPWALGRKWQNADESKKESTTPGSIVPWVSLTNLPAPPQHGYGQVKGLLSIINLARRQLRSPFVGRCIVHRRPRKEY